MLKINSNFSDYYDCAIGSFVDSDVIINRKTEKVKIHINDFPSSVLSHQDMYDYSWSYHKRSLYGSSCMHLIGFCGKWYYYTWIEKRTDVCACDIVRQYCTFEDITENEKKNSLFSFMNIQHDITNKMRDLNKDPYFSKDFFEQYGPVVYLEHLDISKIRMRYAKSDDERSLEIVKMPCLKDHGFSKIVDPYTALWELEHWYDSHAKPDEAIVPVGDDITRLQAYGFDKKTSFRKMKEK